MPFLYEKRRVFASVTEAFFVQEGFQLFYAFARDGGGEHVGVRGRFVVGQIYFIDDLDERFVPRKL